MTKTVTFIEINVYEKMLPLVSGYLEAYARADVDLRDAYRFFKYVTTRTTPVEALCDDLVRRDSDIYAFSCYLWNMGVVKAVLPLLLKARPNALVLLGGPQVMHHAPDYLDRTRENLLICNGEGEITFSNFLREVIAGQPDFSRVRGLSFYRDSELVTTDRELRIQTLDDIPSPFLNKLFETPINMSVVETNRGCPFRCAFCFWGAANNDRVYKFSEDRIREELRWISQNAIPTILIADANWGMLKRDIALSEHIAECRQEYFAPTVVHFSAAKNSPDRVAEITRVFKRAGLFSPQPISMQSLDETALEQIERTNIKLGAFESLQNELNESEIGSYIELIWPLPGETLSSFKAGVSKLCERKAHTIVTYVHLLLHNTPLFARREELKLVTRRSPDGLAEADIVIQTADVSAREFEDGMWFIYACIALYNARILNTLTRYLHGSGTASYGDVFSAFVEFCKIEAQHPYPTFCRESIDAGLYYDVQNYPTVYFLALHSERRAFDALLYRFASSQDWWKDDNARAMFEIDQLSKPFIYSDTPVAQPDMPLKHIKVIEASNRSYLVEVPEQYVRLLAELVDENGVFEEALAPHRAGAPAVFRIDHKRQQHRYSANVSDEDRANYCSGVIARLSTVLPHWATTEEVQTEPA